MEKVVLQYDTYTKTLEDDHWNPTQKWFPTLNETLDFVHKHLFRIPQGSAMKLVCGVADHEGETVTSKGDVTYFFIHDRVVKNTNDERLLPAYPLLRDHKILLDLGRMTDDGVEYRLYLVESSTGVKKVTYVCDGEEHCLPDVDLISVKSVRTTFPNPSEATKAEAVLKETFRQLWGSSNGLSTNVPCCAEQYPSDVDADFVEGVYAAFGLTGDVIDCGRDNGDPSVESLEEDTILFDYLLHFDMRGREDWFN